MYDPLIVDAFIAVHTELVPKHLETKPHFKQGLSASTRVTITNDTAVSGPGFENIFEH